MIFDLAFPQIQGCIEVSELFDAYFDMTYKVLVPVCSGTVITIPSIGDCSCEFIYGSAITTHLDIIIIIATGNLSISL